MPKITNARRNLYNKVNNHKKNLHEYDVELQHKSCNQYKEMLNILKCNRCLDPYANEEEYLLKRFRAFCANKKGLDLVIISLTQLSRDPPLSFNFKSTKSSLTKEFEEYRHVCDVCLTSIFNLHYVCSGCAINLCIHCYNYWRQVKNDPKKTACHRGLKHAPQMFTVSQKYASEDMETLMMELNEEVITSNKKKNLATEESVVSGELSRENYSDQEIETISSRDNSKHISTTREFSGSYESEENLKEYCERLGTSKVINIKDWPPKDNSKEVLSNLHANFMNKVLLAPDYCNKESDTSALISF
ncbi:hypothetical protein K501DRAFT_276434 [Backusella circina FSU 941]|nr:hypothetical protein K501DRAFT_276434 [Backusella circina FSU 941]